MIIVKMYDNHGSEVNMIESPTVDGAFLLCAGSGRDCIAYPTGTLNGTTGASNQTGIRWSCSALAWHGVSMADTIHLSRRCTHERL
jgi:hypothetical protein